MNKEPANKEPVNEEYEEFVKIVRKWTIRGGLGLIFGLLFLVIAISTDTLQIYDEDAPEESYFYDKCYRLTEDMTFEVKYSATDEEMYVQLFTLGKYLEEKVCINKVDEESYHAHRFKKVNNQIIKNITLIKEFEKAKVHEIIEQSAETEKYSKADKAAFLAKYDNLMDTCKYGYFYMVYVKGDHGSTGLVALLEKLGTKKNIAKDTVRYMRPDSIANSIQAERDETTKNINEYWAEIRRKERLEKEKEEAAKKKPSSQYTYHSTTPTDIEDFDGYDDGDDWAADQVESGAWDDYDDALDLWEDYH